MGNREMDGWKDWCEGADRRGLGVEKGMRSMQGGEGEGRRLVGGKGAENVLGAARRAAQGGDRRVPGLRRRLGRVLTSLGVLPLGVPPA